MKRFWLLLIVLIAIGQSAHAQGVKFGLTASPQFAFASTFDNDVSTDGVKLGLEYGLLVDYILDINGRYAFHTGFLHSLTGAKVAIEQTDTSGNTTIIRQDLKYQYINIPLTMRLRTNEIGYITYWGQFGLTPGINVSSRIDQSAEPDPNEVYLRENEKLGGESVLFNLSLTVGGGIEYSLGGATALMVGLQYQNGFTNVLDNDNLLDETINFRNLTLRAGFLF